MGHRRRIGLHSTAYHYLTTEFLEALPGTEEVLIGAQVANRDIIVLGAGERHLIALLLHHVRRSGFLFVSRLLALRLVSRSDVFCSFN